MKSHNYYYTRDQLGSIRELVDSSGTIRARYDYDPYGNRGTNQITVNPVEADLAFAGYYYHPASGLFLAPFRAYISSSGSWLSRDPLSEQYDVNLYRYVYNDPINYFDPNGEFPVPASIAIALAEAAALSQLSIDYIKDLGYSEADRARATAANNDAMQKLQDIIDSEGEKSFQDEGLGVGGIMGGTLPCKSKSQGLRNLFESLFNLEGIPSALNEYGEKFGNNASGSQIPSEYGLQTPDQRAQLARAWLERDRAYGAWLNRLY